MKSSIVFAVAAVLAFVPDIALAQEDPGPSPTNSYDCEPHGDHWHCEGAITPSATLSTTPTAPAVVITTTSTAHDDHDHDDHSSGTGSIAPSPTESIGCEPHGDHWHCDGPAVATTTGAAAATTTSEPHDDHDDHASGTGSLSPSPTESAGCEPHGDHWHCEGPAAITSVAVNRTVTPSQSAPAATSSLVEANSAVSQGIGYSIFAAVCLLFAPLAL